MPKRLPSPKASGTLLATITFTALAKSFVVVRRVPPGGGCERRFAVPGKSIGDPGVGLPLSPSQWPGTLWCLVPACGCALVASVVSRRRSLAGSPGSLAAHAPTAASDCQEGWHSWRVSAAAVDPPRSRHARTLLRVVCSLIFRSSGFWPQHSWGRLLGSWTIPSPGRAVCGWARSCCAVRSFRRFRRVASL